MKHQMVPRIQIYEHVTCVIFLYFIKVLAVIQTVSKGKQITKYKKNNNNIILFY